MTDLISRRAAKDAFLRATADGDKVEFCWWVLDGIPSAERCGKWHITDAYPHNVYCSECYARFAQTHWAVWEDGSLPRNYCPSCGAKMEAAHGE